MLEPVDATPKKQSSTSQTASLPLSNRQDSYHSLFMHLKDGFAYCKVIYNKQGAPVDYVFCDANLAFLRITRLYDKPVIGKKAAELFPWLGKCDFDWMEVCGKVAQTTKPLTFEGYCEMLGRWLLVNAYSPQKGYVAMIIRDITARKKTEQALRQNERQYKKLANSITDPFFALNASLKFTYWNSASEKFMGIKAQDAMGKHFFEVFDKNRATCKTASIYLKVMKTKNSRTVIDRLPKASKEYFFEIQIYPTGNGISVLAKDITKRKKQQVSMEEYTKSLEETVRVRTEKLKDAERLAAIGETAGMIGHDIRNPLQSIIGELYLAKGELGALPQSEARGNLLESVSSIEEQILYINKIVTDLQDYAKALTPTSQDTDLEAIIQCVINELETPSHIKISQTFAKPLPMLKTDPSFIKRILTNLIRNGIQAMEEQQTGELSVQVFFREKTVTIGISDTGRGIPDEAKERIFKPLFTTKSKGQGFGLAVVKKLVEALEGNVSFETKVGKGTTFIVELPH
jgi:PAS domain S-box-containing protein